MLNLKWKLVSRNAHSNLFGLEYQAKAGDTWCRVLQHKARKDRGEEDLETWTYSVNGDPQWAPTGQTKAQAQAKAEAHILLKIVKPGMRAFFKGKS